MSEGNIAKIFESIPQNETYSRYNSTLEKIFKSQSLRYFINLYKKRRAMVLHKKENNDYTHNIFNEDFLYKKMKDDENNIFDDVNNEESEKSDIKPEESNQELFKKLVELKRNKVTQSLDPFKYHPNYNSIYRNIPSVRITKPTKILKTLPNENYKDRNKNKKLEKKLNKLLLTEINNTFNEKSKQPKNRNNKTFDSLINFTEKNEKGKNNLPKLKVIQKNKNMTLFQDRNNHALRFSKYLPRKFVIPENNKNISYIGPFNYIKPRNKTKSIDFDKMLHRNGEELINKASLKVPSFGQYNPNYKWIDKDKNGYYFNPEEKEKEKHKKFLIKKICTSYHVNTEYEIVDNEMLKK